MISTVQESTATKRERVISLMKQRHRLNGQHVIGVQVFQRVGRDRSYHDHPWLEHWHVIYSGGEVRTYVRLEPEGDDVR